MDRKKGTKTGLWLFAALAASILIGLAPQAAAAEKDYILGRPMTDEEIQAQIDLEPELTEFPELDIERPETTDGVSALTSALPSSYDARDDGLITDVKNQLPYGTCWAFSAISSAETSLIQKGFYDSGLDLSELQLTYFFYHSVPDPLGGTAGDSTVNLQADYLYQGGNGIFTTFELASWVGAAPEEKAKYEDASSSLKLSDSLARDADAAHMQNAYWISLTDVDTVKQMVMDYGNVSISFYYADSYMNFDTGAYYNSRWTATNHAVNIVGWDDSYSRQNFKTRPSADGAWLVKNNWGEDWGDGGYFWISYEEVSFTDSSVFGFVYDFEPADNYDFNYQYDGSFGYGRGTIASGSSVANVFTVSGSDYEKLSAVSLACYSPGVTYSLQIYRNPTEGNPTSGTALLDQPQTGTISYTGYVTIPLEQTDVVFAKGDTFSVVFTLKGKGGSSVDLFVDESYVQAGSGQGAWVRFVNDTKVGQSYAKIDGVWEDLGLSTNGAVLGEYGQTIRIKAFTDRCEAVPIKKASLSRTSLSLNLGKKKTLTLSWSPVRTTDSLNVTWKSSDTSVVTVKDGTVSAVGIGTATVTAKIGSKKATCKVTVSLGTPTLSSAKATGYRKIRISWKSVSGAGGYRVKRKTSGGKWTTVADVTGRSYTDTVPGSSKTYIYTVRAWTKSNGKKVWSSYDKTGVSAKAVPEKPALKKISVSTKGVKLTWQSVTCDGFRIYRKTGSGKWKRIKSITDPKTVSWRDTSVTAGKTYTYTVRAYFKNGSKRAFSARDKTGLSAQVTPKKVTLKKAAPTADGIRVTWKSVNADGYRVYRKTSGGQWKKIASLKGKSTVSYTDTAAKKGKTYIYTVRAYYKAGGKVSLGPSDRTGVRAAR